MLQEHHTTLLGFDVADSSLVSSLTNCGYEASVREFLCDRFVGDINDWHLFRTADAAKEFAVHSDKLVAEHAPFQVYKIEEIDVD